MLETNRCNTCLCPRRSFHSPSSRVLPSPSSISAVRKDRWRRASSPSPLSYFHKPIIAHHLGRLRPCLSPIQPGGGRGARGPALLLGRHRDLRHHPVAMGTLSWSQAGPSPGEGCGGGGSSSPHPSPPREEAGRGAWARLQPAFRAPGG